MTKNGFDKRTSLSEEMTEILLEDVLNIDPLEGYRFGIEKMPKRIHKLLRDTHEKNVQFVRYLPDVLVIDTSDPSITYFVELKVADTGIRKQSFFQKLIEERPEMADEVKRPYPKKEEMSKKDIFNVELSAHDLYQEYEKFIDVIIVGYATFRKEGLMARKNKDLDIVSYYTPGKKGRPAVDGSYTRIANIDFRSLKKLENVLLDKHKNLDEEELKSGLKKAEERLSNLSKE